ncbi:MAG: FHA domain-containing protein, partial [Stomatobaculum sp.]|nr:FHA domain-containing protein [Stomatobaculum sp.]
GIVFAVMKKKKKEEDIVPLPPGPGPMPPQPPYPPDGGSRGGTDTDFMFGERKVLMLRLQDLKNPVKQFEYPLHGRVKLGKKPEICQVVIDYDKSVSKLHCEIYAEGRKFYIRDLNSTNGTYVDNQRIADVHELYSGSTIRLGRVEMKVWIR